MTIKNQIRKSIIVYVICLGCLLITLPQANIIDKDWGGITAARGERDGGFLSRPQTNLILINELFLGISENESYENRMWWAELYNPTSETVNISGWEVRSMHAEGGEDISYCILSPFEYIIITNALTQFYDEWTAPNSTKVIGLRHPYCLGNNDSLILFEWIHEGSKHKRVLVDILEYGWEGKGPIALENHSIARYKWGYSTDNCSDEFYDEPNPTPGRENTMQKPSKHPPLPKISSPEDGTTFANTAKIYFDCSNSSNLDNDTLTFYWDSNISDTFGNDTRFYKQLSAGVHLITLYVWNGYYRPYDTVTITVNNQPVVNIIAPSADQIVNKKITISGNASDVVGGIQKVEIKIDSGNWQIISGATNWSYSWDTTRVSNGLHTIYVRANDGIEYSETQSIGVNVNNKKENRRVFISGFGTFCLASIICTQAMLVKCRVLGRSKRSRGRKRL